MLAVLFILIGNLVYSIGAAAVVSKIKGLGAGDVGLEVEVGTKFQALTWESFALMFVAMVYWVYEFVVATKARRRLREIRSKADGYEMDSLRARMPRAGRGW